MDSVQDLAEKWLQQDRDEATRKEISDLLQANNEAELEKRLRKRIAFGTAGLRSSMKAGFAHMNSLTVLQASQGLAAYVLEQATSINSSLPSEKPSIVVGFDARHNSEKFARLAAGAFLAKGIKVLWFGRLVHTPMVPFAVSRYSAAAGIMVTASHNPKNDNGYKVYWKNGSQIVPPHDSGIAQSILNKLETQVWDTTTVDDSQHVENIFDDSTKAYIDALRALVTPRPGDGQSVPFTYTAMHGVGLPFMQRAVQALGFENDQMHVVQAQAQPDPEFPTIPFPNPEERGALDLAMAEAEASGSSLVLANDPDADRFAVAEYLDSGEWHQFTGNQMGILLASYVLETRSGPRKKLAMLASTVSSRMLSSMAEKEGFLFKETLTGFKWLGNVAQDLRDQGYEPAYAYEEAIGYMLPSVVWDKDGIAAAVVFLRACQRWKGQGLTPFTKLRRLYQAYGYFEDANTYLISQSPDTTDRVFQDIRKPNGQGSPLTTVGKRKIRRWRDLTIGYDSDGLDGKPDLPTDKSAQMITCVLDDVVFTARGSGTEPKIKLYIEAKSTSSEVAKQIAKEVLQDLLREWFRPEYGLRLAGT